MNTPISIHALILLLFLGLPAITRAQDDAAVASPVTLSTGWLMQDVAQVKDTGDAISKVGYTTPVYLPVPYALPASASANAADGDRHPRGRADRASQHEGGIAGRGARGNSGLNDTDPKAAATQGASLWPINAEANRPSFSSDWQQAPAPSANAMVSSHRARHGFDDFGGQ